MSHGDDSPGCVAAHLTSIRGGLMGGRGQGASADEISAVTRNRVEVAGMTATRRLELTARQTGRARRDPDAVTSAIQLSQAEAAHDVDEDTGRLLSRSSPMRSTRSSRPVTRCTVVGLVGAVAVSVLRRKSRD